MKNKTNIKKKKPKEEQSSYEEQNNDKNVDKEKLINKIVQHITDSELEAKLRDYLYDTFHWHAADHGGFLPYDASTLHYKEYDGGYWVGELFPVSKEDIIKNKSEQFNKSNMRLILKGIYNAYMPNGNTYFHSLIENNCTQQTLKILKKIHRKCVSKYRRYEIIPLHKIIPFTLLDNGECKKNFLMLAISKKYDSDYYIYKYKIFPDEYAEMKDYAKTYQKHDKRLIRWLIKKAPIDCIKQKDSDGYNLVDYALMKMDADILQMIINRSKKDNVLDDMIKNSRLLKSVINNSFTHKEATKLLAKRYNYPIAIDEEPIWNSKKDNIINNILLKLTPKTISLDDFFSQIETMQPKNVNIEIKDIQQARSMINEKCQVGFFESIFCCCSTDVCKRKKRKEELLKAIDGIQANAMTNQIPTISLDMRQIQQLSGRE